MPAEPELSGAVSGLCFGRGARMTVLSGGLGGLPFELIDAPPARCNERFVGEMADADPVQSQLRTGWKG